MFFEDFYNYLISVDFFPFQLIEMSTAIGPSREYHIMCFLLFLQEVWWHRPGPNNFGFRIASLMFIAFHGSKFLVECSCKAQNKRNIAAMP